MSHNKPDGASGCECEEQSSVPFLDTALEIKNRKFISDLYRKPSDPNKYLLPSSDHPSHVTGSVTLRDTFVTGGWLRDTPD